MLCLHVPSLLPHPFADMDTSSVTQAAALAGVGLLYQVKRGVGRHPRHFDARYPAVMLAVKSVPRVKQPHGAGWPLNERTEYYTAERNHQPFDR